MAFSSHRHFYSLFLINLLFKCVHLLNPFEIYRYKGANENACQEFTKAPFFEHDIIVGKPWRIYYTWNLNLDTKCVDMVFKNTTQQSINRVWADMSEYMESQPVWESASLHVSMGTASHELLLIPDEGPAGRFLGVPNIVRDGRGVVPTKGAVPLLRMAMKLIKNGKYLVVMDCIIGVASLSARPDDQIYRMDIASAVADLNIGDGFPACTTEKNIREQFLF